MIKAAALVTLLVAAACGGDGVTSGEATRLVVLPEAVSLAPGETRRLEAIAYDAGGDEIGGVQVSWSSDASAVATVDGEGQVTAVAPGGARIVARAAGATASAVVSVTAAEAGMVDVIPSATYQTMTGWEATAQAGELECNQQAFGIYRNQLFDRAANELGINRLRLEIRSGIENPIDWFSRHLSGQISYAEWKTHWWDIQNDNASPTNMAATGFHWAFIDHTIDNVVQPMRQRLQARGEKLYVNLTYVDFGASPFEHSTDPAEFAEFILATFQHIKQKYGWEPDALEMILEPDNTQNWHGESIGRALVAAGDRLKASGFRPAFIAPSNTNMSRAVEYFDAMLAVPRVREYLSDFAYHRYGGVSAAALNAIGQRSVQHGVRTAMLEHIGSGIDELLDDVLIGRASAWQQFALAYCSQNDSGGVYFMINQSNPASPTVTTTALARMLRQVFLYVRQGAVRIGATTGDGRLRPVAFRNDDGGIAVIVRTNGAANFQVRGLPAGRYGISYTTPSAYAVDAADVTIAAGGTVPVSIPGAGAITVYRR